MLAGHARQGAEGEMEDFTKGKLIRMKPCGFASVYLHPR